ncbi:MAG: hypothetical protein GXX96_21965 [Planctomycetaceae bacterium]|jgi:hypothetical protein|nr:hypothetical protein [Planctomycetaceae bacterium]
MRIHLEEIRSDGKVPRKFVYLSDDKHPHPRIHQVEHYADVVSDNNLLEAVVVSKLKFEEICKVYKRILVENNNELSKEHRREIEDLAYEEHFVPHHLGMLLFYHPQMNELRGREVHPPDTR